MRTTKVQISLRIRAVWSAPLLFAAWIVKYLVSVSEISRLYCLASVAAQAGLSITGSKIPKTGFLVTRLVTRKPFFGVSDQGRLKPACAATEASWVLKFWKLANTVIILSKQRTTKVQIRLRGCAGWSAPLLFAYGKNRFSHDVAHICSAAQCHCNLRTWWLTSHVQRLKMITFIVDGCVIAIGLFRKMQIL